MSIPTAIRRHHAYLAVDASYPLLNYVPNLFETLLLSTIFLTVSINAIAQLLVQGRVEQLFSGLGIISNGLPSELHSMVYCLSVDFDFLDDDDAHNGFFANLPYEEDFIIVLLRVGVASLEATGLRGWTNEVAPIQRPGVRPRRLRVPRGQRSGLGLVTGDTYGCVQMGRFSVAQIEYGSTSLARPTPPVSSGMIADVHSYDDIVSARRRPRRPTPGTPRVRRGFNNDIRNIDLGMRDGSPFSGLWTRNIVALWQFLVVLSGVLRGLVLVLLDKARRRARHPVREMDRKTSFDVGEELDGDEAGESTKEEQKRKRTETEMYHRFLRGEEISDDDEDEAATPLSDDDETSEDSEEEDVHGGREAEAIGLLTDILRNGGNSAHASSSTTFDQPSAREMVLAHLLHDSDGSSHPLTRRRWNALVRRDQVLSTELTDATDWSTDGKGLSYGFATSDSHERHIEKRDKEQGLQHICVICLLETREIICWPCRYVSLQRHVK